MATKRTLGGRSAVWRRATSRIAQGEKKTKESLREGKGPACGDIEHLAARGTRPQGVPS